MLFYDMTCSMHCPFGYWYTYSVSMTLWPIMWGISISALPPAQTLKQTSKFSSLNAKMRHTGYKAYPINMQFIFIQKLNSKAGLGIACTQESIEKKIDTINFQIHFKTPWGPFVLNQETIRFTMIRVFTFV